MNLTTQEALESNFNQLSELLVNHLQSDEHLSIELSGEQSHFLRFNTAKVRQAGIVCDSTIQLTLINQQKTAYTAFPFSGDLAFDTAIALDKLNELKKEVTQLPEDPYIVLPENKGSSRDVYTGELLPIESAVDEILKEVQSIDFTGIYASGTIIRANANSAGQKHWFATESFFLDYSLIAPSSKAVKATLAGREWQASRYREQIQLGIEQLKILNDTPVHEVKPGRYRTYLAPAATAEILSMFSWGGVSESSMRQGESALTKLREGKTLSPLFNLRENFTSGSVPRFNELGEIAPDEIPIIIEGKLVNTLVSSRTALEYGLQANGASGGEGLRSPEVSTGTLQNSEILKQLDTGLYLSNLHYLNWSDRPGGRLTGMTRYACFWVENGQIVAPIKDLRFDDSLYAFLGENLIALTDFQDFVPNTDTYERRSLGGLLMPGLLVEDFTFTL
ncbi:TldD/PmbA family protein [Chroococcus sp. FPU101]|uniref:TldD/PmbA family protein n=1 Tax=Chroococcus sp. FPU101 TaxID=1974212 RepID=UPI001A8E3B57|nr:TldD/PmbA family protein [Chroococcus sp. FPU101]GFE71713.1 Zn-dependent protease [Chroococcus sp. FPU101]